MPSIDISALPSNLFLNQSFTALWVLYNSDGVTLVTIAPDTVKIEWTNPSGTSTVYTYGTDNEVQKITDPHTYRTNNILNAEGYWDWKFKAEWTSIPSINGNIIAEGRVKVDSNRSKTI